MEQDLPWDEIARAWNDPEARVAAIAAHFGLSEARLKREAKARNWPRRGTLRRKPRKSGAKAPGPSSDRAKGKTVQMPKAGAPAVKPLGLVKRVYNTIDKELSKLEAHKGASSQDRERASRALSQMVSSLEKAVEMQREITKEQGRTKAGGKDKEALKHAEDLRREIAERLEKLHRQRATAK